MTSRRSPLLIAFGILCATVAVLTVRRRAADAQRHGASVTLPLASSAIPSSAPADGPHAVHAAPITTVVEGFDPSLARRDHDRFIVDLPRDRHAVLTLEPNWQRGVTDLLTAYGMPRASVVVMDTDTGRIRIYASRSEPGASDMARDPTPPAASVFKIVTASALVQHGVDENTVTCFSGGFHAIHPADLVANPQRDHDCISLGEAFGRSANTVFARRAIERLTPPDLLSAAQAWGFGEAVPFDAPVTLGTIDVPEVPLDFARTAAGFWHSHLSPLHAAVIAQGVARGGEMQRPYIIESIQDAHGTVLATGAPHVWRRAVSPEVATAISHMMVHSVSEGTAFHAFHDNAGRAFLPGVDVRGKTGTLTGDTPFRAYTWFVGNATDGTTRVSFAVMVANGPVWRVRAAALARQALQIVYRGRATD